jgi:type IV pilus assembly protein PilC
MPDFDYIALNAQGQETAGSISATNEGEASSMLRGQNLFPTKLAPKGQLAGAKKKVGAARKSRKKGAAGGGTVKGKILMIFTRQLATLIDAGLPLLRGLTVLGKQEPNPVLQRTILAIADSVQTGSTFSESLAQHPKIFNKLYINMVKAGELGGVLEVVLNRLAEYQEKAQKLKNKIVSAMVYPVIVMFIAVAIVFFLLLFIVPKFKKIFEEMLGAEEPLPLITRIVTGASGWLIERPLVLPNGLLLVMGAFAFGFAFKAFTSTVKGRQVVDRLKLNLPIFGDIQRKSAISRFSRTLGTLVTSGVPILQALNITRDTSGNVVVADAITKVHDAVREGESMVAPLEASKVFPAMVISMVDVGEETGQLPEMLLKIADVYDDEVDNSVAALTSLLEPIMIVFLALIVGVIVLALFLPLVKIIQKLQQ